jgi:hypothetical protein
MARATTDRRNDESDRIVFARLHGSLMVMQREAVPFEELGQKVFEARLQGNTLPVAGRERIGTRAMIGERIFLGLRSGGLDLAGLAADLGYDLASRQREMLRWMTEADLAGVEGGILRLTAKGYVLCDEVCRRVLQQVSVGTDRPATEDGDRRVS